MPEKTFDVVALTSDVVNKWLKETEGLPSTLAISRLGFYFIEALNVAYEQGRSDGIREGLPDDNDEEEIDV